MAINISILSYITQFKLRSPDLGECLQNVRLEEDGDLSNISCHMVHHRKDAIVHKLAVLVKVLQQEAVAVHTVNGGESEKSGQYIEY